MNKIVFEDGLIIDILGKKYKIKHQESLRGVTCLYEDKILVFGYKEYLAQKVTLLLKRILAEQIQNLADKHVQTQNVKYKKISIKDLRSRWGSCSVDKNLSFNLRLIFLPLDVVEYVVIHEICHLLEMNHSSRFWDHVAKIMPNYKVIRKTLNNHTKEVFRYIL